MSETVTKSGSESKPNQYNQWDLPVGPNGGDDNSSIIDDGWEFSIERPSAAGGRSILSCTNRQSQYQFHVINHCGGYEIVVMEFEYNMHDTRPPTSVEKERTTITIQTNSIIRTVRDLCNHYTPVKEYCESHPLHS